MSKIEAFEDWLMERYVEEEHPLDDMIPDGFNGWLEQLDIQELIDYADKYHKALTSDLEAERKAKEEAIRLLDKCVNEFESLQQEGRNFYYNNLLPEVYGFLKTHSVSKGD